MKETEKTILAMAIEYPETRFFFFENCDADFFQSGTNKKIFKLIDSLQKENISYDWLTLIDLSSGIPQNYFTDMVNSLKAVHQSGVMSLIREKIALIKNIRAKRDLLREIEKQAKVENPDFEEIKNIVEGTKIISLDREDTNFESAYEEYLNWREKESSQVRLGLPTLDRWIGGFRYGEIISILGRTGLGKTMVALKYLQEIPDELHPMTGFFSFEMPKPAIVERLLQLYFNVWREELDDKIDTIEIGYFKEKYRQIKLYTRIYTADEISKIIERDKLKIIFIDFLQLMKDDNPGGSSYERTSQKMKSLKHIAMNQDVLIFLLVQLSRKAGSGWEIVTIDSARESGQIEELSDFIVGIWNPSLNLKFSEAKKREHENQIRIALLKNKRGPTAFIKAHFDKRSGKIFELEEER